MPTSVTDSVTALLVNLSDTDQGKALLAPTSSDGFIAASDADCCWLCTRFIEYRLYSARVS
ncbi:MAG: hypothetical protein B7X52_02110 [Thiotrichales bacterium 34-46-19]|nr:MAG: hypothetical protein B7X52_02110 [Thiotrichales bacterium 34-46-19]